MEHNEYALYKIKVKGTRRVIEHINHQDSEIIGMQPFEDIVNVVAPKERELAIPLITYTLRSMSWDADKFAFEILTIEELKAIIRFENAYRARL